jgi:NhaP-type Na+/H+ or K+/H+ antiporter
MISSYLDWAIIALVCYIYILLAGRLQQTPISGALLFLFVGLILGPACLGWLRINVTSENLKTAAELTLALILFTDAANANLPLLRNHVRLPMRLLGLGLPLTILFGFGVGLFLFPAFNLTEVAILSVVLAPTDAALGQSVVTNPLVPAAIREDLSVESGLNDGVCVPFLVSLLAFAHRPAEAYGLLVLTKLFIQQLGIGVLVGSSIALIGAWSRDRCRERCWIPTDWQPVLAIAMAVACFSVAQQIGGSGFIACFTAGLVYGGLTRSHKQEELVAAEATGDVLSLVTWVAFGSEVAGKAIGNLNWSILFYALLSLTVVRMVPVALATRGLNLSRWTTFFVGWFGPRGLASIVFAVLVLDEKLPHGHQIIATIAFTILLSVIAHGITAPGLVCRYGRFLERHRNEQMP